jgi:hypothetical protein
MRGGCYPRLLPGVVILRVPLVNHSHDHNRLAYVECEVGSKFAFQSLHNNRPEGQAYLRMEGWT